MKKAILGLGEELKADDGVGKYVIDKLKKRKSKHLLLYSSVPENAFTKLRNKDIGELTIVDAADFSGRPGEIRIVSDFKETIRLSTHSTSVSKMVDYIKKSIGIKHVTIILIQAKSLEFGEEMSPEVKQAGDMVIDLLS
jgi:hydrogenase 3 maturation protease